MRGRHGVHWIGERNNLGAPCLNPHRRSEDFQGSEGGAIARFLTGAARKSGGRPERRLCLSGLAIGRPEHTGASGSLTPAAFRRSLTPMNSASASPQRWIGKSRDTTGRFFWSRQRVFSRGILKSPQQTRRHRHLARSIRFRRTVDRRQTSRGFGDIAAPQRRRCTRCRHGALLRRQRWSQYRS